VEFVTRLFDTSDFPARWYCGNWSEGHGWLHILSDLGVWSAYVTIPLVLGFFILQRKDLPFRGIFILFGAFILACGTTHLMEAVIFWWPAYRLAGLIKLFTAVVSWATVFALVPIIPQALTMRSNAEPEREVGDRERAAALRRRWPPAPRRLSALPGGRPIRRWGVGKRSGESLHQRGKSARVVAGLRRQLKRQSVRRIFLGNGKWMNNQLPRQRRHRSRRIGPQPGMLYVQIQRVGVSMSDRRRQLVLALTAAN